MNFRRSLWVLMTCLMLPMQMFSDEKTDQLIQHQMECEIRDVGQFINDYNGLVQRKSLYRFNDFEFLVSKNKDNLNNYLNVYKDFFKQQTRKECLDQAIAGTENVLKSMDDLLYGRNHDEVEQLLHSGIKTLGQAKKHIEFSRWCNKFGYGFSFNSLSLGKPLLFVYIYLLLIGLILNKSFKKKLQYLIQGKTDQFKFKEDAIYGVHLIILLPILFLSLIFILLLVWDLGWLAAYVLKTGIPIAKIIMVFIFVLILSVLGLLISVFTSSKEYGNGLMLTRDIEPKLWSLCDDVAKDIGTKPLDKIVLSFDGGIGVYETGGLFELLFGRPKRILTMGIGTITALTISQMKSILGHEFGHFSKKDTAWSTLTFTMSNIVHNSLAQMESMQKEPDSILVQIIAVCNPIYWVLMAYRFLFLLMTNGFSRVREVHADKTAISLYGHRHFADGLLKVVKNDVIFSKYYLPEMLAKIPQDLTQDVPLFCDLERAFQSIENSETANINAVIYAEPLMDIYSTHPALKDRLNYASRFATGVQIEDQNENFHTIFHSWNETKQTLSDGYNQCIRAYIKHAEKQATEGRALNQQG